MKVYIAAPWKRKLDAKLASHLLTAAGHVVTSRWIDYHGDTTDPEELAIEAVNDMEDLDAADVLLLLNLEKSEGKAVETGIALVEGLWILGVGQPSNVFHYLPEIQWVESMTEAISALAGTDDAA